MRTFLVPVCIKHLQTKGRARWDCLECFKEWESLIVWMQGKLMFLCWYGVAIHCGFPVFFERQKKKLLFLKILPQWVVVIQCIHVSKVGGGGGFLFVFSLGIYNLSYSFLYVKIITADFHLEISVFTVDELGTTKLVLSRLSFSVFLSVSNSPKMHKTDLNGYV